MNITITTSARIPHITASAVVVARILPKRYELRSVFTPDTLTNTTPIASAVLEIIAIAASPLILLFSESLKSRNAAIMITGTATSSGARFSAAATASAPKPT